MNPSRRLALLVSTLVLASSLPATASAQRRKLNGPLATAYLTDVGDYELANGRVLFREGRDLLTVPLNGSAPAEVVFHPVQSPFNGYTARLTPDGSRVLLRGDIDSIGVLELRELFSFPADGSGSPVKLNAPVEPSSAVRSFEISPDSEFVVYTLNSYVVGDVQLFSARTDGSQPAVHLAPGAISRFQITADSSHVLAINHNSKLFTVPIDGSAPPTFVHGEFGAITVWEFELAPDGSRVAYRIEYPLGGYDLYSAPADGSEAHVRLRDPLGAGSVGHFHVSRFSTHAAYVADEESDGVAGLYGIPIAGGPVVRISAGAAGRTIVEARISPDRSRMVYLGYDAAAQRYDLHGVPSNGSQPPVNLSSAAPFGPVEGFLTDPATGRLLFRVYRPRGAQGTLDLYAAPNDGSAAAVRLSPASVTVGVEADAFALASGSRAVFLADPSEYQTFELFSAPLDGSTPAVRLHPPLVAGGNVHSFVLDPAGNRALYRAEQDIPGLVELFVVKVDGSAPPAVRSTVRQQLSTVGSVDVFELTRDGATVIYSANQASGNGLYAVELDGAAPPIQLAVPGGVFRLTPDSERVVYRGSPGLYSVPRDASAAPTLLASGMHLDSTSLQISPDSSRVVHVNQTDDYSPFNRLFSTRAIGGGSVELNVPRAFSGEILVPEVSPDSTRVVYAGIQQTAGVVELFSAPLTGGAAPVKLNDALVAGGNVVAQGPLARLPRISADSSRVVYLADRDANEAFELYSAPLAGGAAPSELSALPGSDRDVTSFAISPDSTRVVYVADQDLDQQFELYSAPLAGGEAPVELSAVAGPGDDVDTSPFGDAFLISPDSSWVVYRAGLGQEGVFGLFRAPLTGGTPPVALTSGPADSRLLMISPDSERVLFARAGASGTGLWSLPLGGGSSVLLSAALPLVLSTTFGPDPSLEISGRWVLFQAAPDQAGAWEHFAAPIDGLGPPVRINGQLPGAGAWGADASFRPGSSSIVYRAAEDEAGVAELYYNAFLSATAGRHRPR